jgi:hypothetical protein
MVFNCKFVARMSAAICGSDPGYRCAHRGYAFQIDETGYAQQLTAAVGF